MLTFCVLGWLVWLVGGVGLGAFLVVAFACGFGVWYCEIRVCALVACMWIGFDVFSFG